MPSFRLARPALLALIIGAAFSAGFCLRAQGQDDAFFDLGTYRVALGQLSAGHPQNAQILLETSISRDGTQLAPENALLLAYLQDTNGQTAAARKTLSALTTPSPLASAYMRRLADTAPATGAENPSLVVAPRILAPQPQFANNAARLAASDARLTKLEAFMVDVVNDERVKQGLSRLQTDPQLAEVARAHSAEMRDKKYFEHESPTPMLNKPRDRYMAAALGSPPRIVAENIYRVWGDRSFLTQQDILTAHASLMNSPGHRANLLNRDVTRIGIGLCTDSTGNLWVTQMFTYIP
ncbi:hypothetical protein IAD21_01963 [Abditibacteriota bacterium]|nr:hypothetical protein IAD21_01963 [Abditibacteriota bacterium]